MNNTISKIQCEMLNAKNKVIKDLLDKAGSPTFIQMNVGDDLLKVLSLPRKSELKIDETPQITPNRYIFTSPETAIFLTEKKPPLNDVIGLFYDLGHIEEYEIYADVMLPDNTLLVVEDVENNENEREIKIILHVKLEYKL